MVITFYYGSCVSVSSSIVMIEQLTHGPKFEGLNQAAAGTERKRITEKTLLYTVEAHLAHALCH